MFEKNYYTLRGIADELNIGESTIQYWQDQYFPWIPFKDGGRERWYPKDAVAILRFIMEQASSGNVESEIEQKLADQYPLVNDSAEKEVFVKNGPAETQSTLKGDSITRVLTGLLEGLSAQQMRIAAAQERRVTAEERKAAAMEKRAEAQKLVADALNNVAEALQKLHISSNGSKDGEPAGSLRDARAAVLPELLEVSQEIIATDEPSDPASDPVLDAILEEASPVDESAASIELDDLSRLVEETEKSPSAPLDDLSKLLDKSAVEPAIDDLSALVDAEPEQQVAPELDDLSKLVDPPKQAVTPELDDLSRLVEETEKSPSAPLDDLSKLLDKSAVEPAIDDLSALVDAEPEQQVAPELDDLSALVDHKPQVAATELDDLSALVEDGQPRKTAAETSPSSTPTTAKPLKPKTDGNTTSKLPGDYKSKIIALIIQLKEKKGMNIETVTAYMNKKGYKTISGKAKWTAGAIGRIFDHIEQVRGGGK